MKTRPRALKKLKGVFRTAVRENFKSGDVYLLYSVHTEYTLHKKEQESRRGRKKNTFTKRGELKNRLLIAFSALPFPSYVKPKGVVQKVTYSKIMQHELKRPVVHRKYSTRIYPGGVRGYCQKVFTKVGFRITRCNYKSFDPQEPDVLNIKTRGVLRIIERCTHEYIVFNGCKTGKYIRVMFADVYNSCASIFTDELLRASTLFPKKIKKVSSLVSPSTFFPGLASPYDV
jgi:hypothetical protein